MAATLSNRPCENFRANLWRPHTCTNCYKSKTLHQLLNKSETPPPHSRNLFRKLTIPARPRKKELRQVASLVTLDRQRVGQSEWEMPQRAHKNGGPVVGVVKPYAVVDIDEDAKKDGGEESNLDSGQKRRYMEPSYQGNSVHSKHSKSTSNLSLVKTKANSGSNQSLDRVSGEANMLETIPKPAQIIGKLLNEYHRSLSVTSIDRPDRSDPKRYHRGKSVEPLDTHKTHTAVTVKRSSSLRQEPTKGSKLMNFLTRRKAATPCVESKSIESGMKSANYVRSIPGSARFSIQPKVTSPHPVRRNQASKQPHSLLVAFKHKTEVMVPPRPRNLTITSPSTEESGLKKHKRSPPPKPPRTLNTFFTSTDQEDLFKQLLDSGSIEDEKIRNKMSTELRMVETPTKLAPLPLPRRPRPGDYDEVIRYPQTDGALHVVPRLPLGHSGDYAEVFSSSGSTNESGLTNSVDSDYNTLQQAPSPPSRAHTHFVLPVADSHSHAITSSQTHSVTPSQEDYYSLPYCTSPTETNSSKVSPTSLTLSTSETGNSKEDYYSLPFEFTHSKSDLLSISSQTPSVDKDTYYSIPLPDSRQATPTEQETASTARATEDLHTLMASTLECLVQRETDKLVCRDDLSGVTDWEKLEVVSENEAVYNGRTYSIKGIDAFDAEAQNNIYISKHLTSHPHLSRVCGMLTTPPTATLLTPSPHYLLTDHTGTNSTHFLLSQRHTLTPHAYTDLVLLTLTQLCSALTHLHSNGICHRDVGIESVYGRDIGGQWLVKLGDFNYALQRQGPVNATTFVYSYNELEWLGGVDSRLPPEVIDTPEDTQTVDYGYTDTFSTGCMIYELCCHSNPFETDADLIFQRYTDQDLPDLEIDCEMALHLQKLATMLVKRDVEERLSSSTALLICQAIKWLPQQWLTSSPSEEEVKECLLLERGRAVCEAAKNREMLPLETVLKGHFLTKCNVAELTRALSVFVS